jgi:hypothetical protein
MALAEDRAELVEKALRLEKRAWESEKNLLHQDNKELQIKVEVLSGRLQQLRTDNGVLQEQLRSSLEENERLQAEFQKERYAWGHERELLMQAERDLQVCFPFFSFTPLHLLPSGSFVSW